MDLGAAAMDEDMRRYAQEVWRDDGWRQLETEAGDVDELGKENESTLEDRGGRYKSDNETGRWHILPWWLNQY